MRTRRLLLVALLFVVPLWLGPGCRPPAAPSLHPAIAPISAPLITGLAGAAALCPRNTLPCFERALQLGAEALEVDLRITRNGDLVCFDDANALAQTGNDREIAASSLIDLRRLDAGFGFTPDGGLTTPYRGQGLQIPTLAEVLVSFPAIPIIVDVRSTTPEMASALTAFASQALSTADRSRVYFRTDDEALALALRQLNPAPFVAFTDDELLQTAHALAAGSEGQLSPLPPGWIQYADDPIALARSAPWARLQAHVHTVGPLSDPARIRSVVEDDFADGVVTARPDLASLLYPKRPLRGVRPGDTVACERLRDRIAITEYTAATDPSNLDAVADRLALGQWFADECISIDQIQVVGSHNSYHVESEPILNAWVRTNDIALWVGWGYSHPPLDEQLGRLGVRQFELDVFLDPAGGLYADPIGNQLAGAPPPNVPELQQPGMKVLHVQDFDFRSNCPTLQLCLETIRSWSLANPNHLPVAVLLELKSGTLSGFGLTPTPAPNWAATDLDDLDTLVRSVFPPDALITPDEVRGAHTTLEQAVLTEGWPRLGEARGRVLFLLDNQGAERGLYLTGRPNLEGRVAFTPSSPGQPDAAFIKANDPLGNVETIRGWVRQGYLVRTRADADTLEGRINATQRREAALRSGAQFVSTDYPEPDVRFGSGYLARMPGTPVARCNPVSSSTPCRDAALAR